MASALNCQAAANLTFGTKKAPAKPSYAAPAGVPLQQQLGWARPQTATFAASSALEPSDAWRSLDSKAFVRPDMMDSADEGLAAFISSTRHGPSQRPQFRSALEQVSYETNHSLMEKAQATKPGNNQRGSIFSKAARIFGK